MPASESHPLKDYLDAHDLTQAQFAKRLGVRQPTISGVIRGQRRFSPLAARRVAELTQGEVPLDFLLFGEKPRPKAKRKKAA